MVGESVGWYFVPGTIHLTMMSNSNTSMSNNRGVDSVSEDRGVDSVGEDGGSVDGVSNNWGSVNGVSNNWGVDSVGNNRAGHDLGGVGGDTDSGAVGRLASVADILDNAVSVVRVGHGLNPAVGEVDGVAAGGGVSVPLLGLGKVGSAVVISHAVVVGVDWGLSEVTSGVTGGGGDNNPSGEGGGDTEESSGTDESLEQRNYFYIISSLGNYILEYFKKSTLAHLHCWLCWLYEYLVVTVWCECEGDIYTDTLLLSLPCPRWSRVTAQLTAAWSGRGCCSPLLQIRSQRFCQLWVNNQTGPH